MESFYYAYRATGDQQYRDWAWNAFVAINSTARVGSGFAELQDVNAADGGGFNDFQDSFWFAEVLKYSYLIHAPVSPRPLSILSIMLILGNRTACSRLKIKVSTNSFSTRRRIHLRLLARLFEWRVPISMTSLEHLELIKHINAYNEVTPK